MPRWKTYTPDYDLLRASGKPLLFCVEGNEKLVREAAARIEDEGFRVYPQVNRAISALSYLSKHAHLRKKPCEGSQASQGSCA
ncbi:MAG: hypothetical protein ACE5JL_17820 [Dehalococcoidia bacterium]